MKITACSKVIQLYESKPYRYEWEELLFSYQVFLLDISSSVDEC